MRKNIYHDDDVWVWISGGYGYCKWDLKYFILGWSLFQIFKVCCLWSIVNLRFWTHLYWNAMFFLLSNFSWFVFSHQFSGFCLLFNLLMWFVEIRSLFGLKLYGMVHSLFVFITSSLSYSLVRCWILALYYKVLSSNFLFDKLPFFSDLRSDEAWNTSIM